MKYTIKIAGNIYEATKFYYERDVTLESKVFEGWFTIAGARIPSQGDTLQVYKEVAGITILKWQGKVSTLDFLSQSSGQVHIIAYDLKRKIKYLHAANAQIASPTKCSAEFSNEVGPSSATTDLTAGTVNTTDTAPDTVNFGKVVNSLPDRMTRDTVLEMLAMITNADVYIHKDGTADFILAGAGTDRSATITLEDGLNGMLADTMGYVEDSTRIVKKVLVRGSGAGSTSGKMGEAHDGTYASTDKIREFNMPQFITNATCASVAANILAELYTSKSSPGFIVQYAKFFLTPDVISIDYDIFDTVTFKARLKNKTVNTKLKIYGIRTDVNNDGNPTEKVTIELMNFNRGVFAQFIHPLNAANAQDNGLQTSSSNTYVQDNVNPPAGANTSAQGQSGSGVPLTINNGFVNVEGFNMSTSDVQGVFLMVSMKITVVTIGSGGILFLRFTDGVNFYPATSVPVIVRYDDTSGTVTYQTAQIYIPKNVNGKTLTLQASVGNTAKIILEEWTTWYTVGLN